jgi:hypothetical protein
MVTGGPPRHVRYWPMTIPKFPFYVANPPHGGIKLDMAVTKPFRRRNGYKFITVMMFMYVTGIPQQRTQAPVRL